ncbi:unnamed protein product [Trichobilharzia regenti]|nr:unnamed protein product [Trichobilharzia regenti]
MIARCICDDGWRGERCTFPVSKNVWSLWSSWSFCEPSCQSSFTEVPPNYVPENWKYGAGTGRWGMRQRSRYRDCLSKASDCNEEIDRIAGFRGFINKTESIWRQYEYRGCRPRPCDRHLYLASGTRALQRSQLSGQVVRLFLTSLSDHYIYESVDSSGLIYDYVRFTSKRHLDPFCYILNGIVY